MAEKTQTTDPADAAREAIEKGQAAGKAYAVAASAAAIAGMRTAFDLQNAVIAAGTQATKSFQAETTKLVEAGAKLVTDTLDTRV